MCLTNIRNLPVSMAMEGMVTAATDTEDTGMTAIAMLLRKALMMTGDGRRKRQRRMMRNKR